MNHQILCVGGPFSGRKVAILHGRTLRFHMPVEPVATSVPDRLEKRVIHFVEYKKQEFMSRQGGRYEFWVPEDQTEDETMQILIDGFKP